MSATSKIHYCIGSLNVEVAPRVQCFSLTLGAHAPEGYGSCPVCVSVCVLSATLIWGLGLVEV